MDQEQKTKITIDSFQMLDTIGRGAYGEVILAKQLSDGRFFAIKKLDKDFIARHHVFIEKEVLSMLRHPGIIKLHSSFQTSSKLYFVLELAQGGDFNKFLALYRRQLKLETIRFYTAQLLLIIEFMHSKGIVHRDLKPENLLLSKNNHLKLIDFATCMIYDETKVPVEKVKKLKSYKDKFNLENDEEESRTERQASFVGTNEYLPPELLTNNAIGPAADLWALGCICYKMFCGMTPFQSSKEQDLFQMIMQSQIKFPESVPQCARNFISLLVHKDPNERFGSNFKYNG